MIQLLLLLVENIRYRWDERKKGPLDAVGVIEAVEARCLSHESRWRL